MVPSISSIVKVLFHSSYWTSWFSGSSINYCFIEHDTFGYLCKMLYKCLGWLCILASRLFLSSSEFHVFSFSILSLILVYLKIRDFLFTLWQEEGPNDRKIGKLCEYAAKNPLRIPKVSIISFFLCIFLSIFAVTKNYYYKFPMNIIALAHD